MRQVADIEYAPQIHGFVVSMPSRITLAAFGWLKVFTLHSLFSYSPNRFQPGNRVTPFLREGPGRGVLISKETFF